MIDITPSSAARVWDWSDRFFVGVGYILTRGAILALGAGMLFLGYAWGWGDGSKSGFMAGCRATTTDTACLYAQDIGEQIERITHSGLPGRALAGEQSDKLDVLCDDLRDRLSRRAAAYYGCPK